MGTRKPKGTGGIVVLLIGLTVGGYAVVDKASDYKRPTVAGVAVPGPGAAKYAQEAAARRKAEADPGYPRASGPSAPSLGDDSSKSKPPTRVDLNR